MDAKRHNTKRFHSRPNSLVHTTKREKAGFTGLDPSKLGLEGPDWLSSPSPNTAGPAESQVSLAATTAQVPHALEANAMPTVPTPSRTLLEGMKVICICKGIKQSVFWKVLDAGTRTIEDLNRCTGAGSGGCSGRRCRPRIADMLRDISQ